MITRKPMRIPKTYQKTVQERVIKSNPMDESSSEIEPKSLMSSEPPAQEISLMEEDPKKKEMSCKERLLFVFKVYIYIYIYI